MEGNYEAKKINIPKGTYTMLFTSILCLGSLIPTAATVAADEIDTATPKVEITTADTDVEKNDKWIAFEKESATTDFKISAEIDPEGTAQYIMNKYDGAAMYDARANVGQRLQNGGWNVHYNTSSGKQTARNGYNAMYVAFAAGAGASAALSKFAAATGVGVIAGAAALLVGAAHGLLASYSKDCRDNIDNHGNTGIARMILTEARWSSQYDHRW